ncbi:MAG TPA: inositol monophosphatase family protein, partial [Geminicoccaceae bacterium]|nr:inositol monophosphatase family protein [Geminicoccaceae bacterium]
MRAAALAAVPPPPAADLLPELVALADRAGAVILRHYAGGGVAVRAKADASPVTAADEAAEAVILEGLARLTPEWPVVAEEAVAAGRVPEVGAGPFWLVDPLDGTKEFLGRNGEFTVNIALVRDRAPVLGVVLAPALERAWWGAVGLGA